MSEIVFEMRDLRVQYGYRCAVDNLSLTLRRGECIGLLGLNGAGKTSTVRALLGMVAPRQGTISLFSMKPGHPKTFARLGFAPEDGFPPEFLSADEYLGFVAALRLKDPRARKKSVDAMLEAFELAPGKKLRDYSKGMRRRLVLAQAFLGSPDLLILDEPLNGLDPLIIIKLRGILDEYRKAGGSLLYSSHILSEVEKSCTRVVILHNGALVKEDSVEGLVSTFGSVEKAFAAQVGGN